jgi:hypothetical protein
MEQINPTNKDMIQNPLEVEKPLGLPNPEYTPPFLMTSKKANKKVATHLDFLRQLTSFK